LSERSAQGYKNEECLACHQDTHLQRSDESGTLQSLHVDTELWKGDTHQKKNLRCVDCHIDFAPFFHPRGGTITVACEQCHAEDAEEHGRSVHQLAKVLSLPQGPECFDCHTDHNVRPATDPLASIHKGNLSATCTQCHDEGKEPEGLVSTVSLLRVSRHSRSDFWGKIRRDMCLQCHHDDLMLKGKRNTRAYCLACHRVKAAAQNIVFGPFHTAPRYRMQPITYLVVIVLIVFGLGLYVNSSRFKHAWSEKQHREKDENGK
jgi:hypothetical protein